jgi:hypothetical protein
MQLALQVTITAEHADRPSCIAEILSRYYPSPQGKHA